MGILNRFSDIMSSNFNDFVEKSKGRKQEKNIKEFLSQSQSDLGMVKAQLNAVKARENSAKLEVDNNIREIAKFKKYVADAKSNNDSDTERKFSQAITLQEDKLQVAIQNYNKAKEEYSQYRQMSEKLFSDSENAMNKINELQGKISQATAQDNSIKINQNLSANLQKIQDELNAKLDYQNALNELNNVGTDRELEDLMKKYS